MSLAGALVRTARPKQWVKNVLVFAAPGAAGVLSHGTPLAHTLLAFAVFCLAASGTYFLNDIFDVDADRHHPTKARRPIASGALSVRAAEVTGGTLVAAALVIAGIAGPWQLTVVVAVYLVITMSYTLYLKHEPILDLAGVAAGFVVRAIAGGVAARVPISQWFLIVASFGSLFMVAGKRSAEHDTLGEARGHHRATLASYSLSYLRYIRTVTSSVTIAAYALWAFERQATAHAGNWSQLSIIPFTLAVFRYALLLDVGAGEAPEDIVLGDPALLVLGAAWAACFALGVYVG
jgi:decaprenyl-phosphate phosphoribosyltransferase